MRGWEWGEGEKMAALGALGATKSYTLAYLSYPLLPQALLSPQEPGGEGGAFQLPIHPTLRLLLSGDDLGTFLGLHSLHSTLGGEEIHR